MNANRIADGSRRSRVTAPPYQTAAQARRWLRPKCELVIEYTCTASTELGSSRIEYEPFGDHYGGNDCMKALVEAFGCRVTDERD